MAEGLDFVIMYVFIQQFYLKYFLSKGKKRERIRQYIFICCWVHIVVQISSNCHVFQAVQQLKKPLCILAFGDLIVNVVKDMFDDAFSYEPWYNMFNDAFSYEPWALANLCVNMECHLSAAWSEVHVIG